MENEIRMTKLASCAGCGAKVGAGTLAKLLKGLPSVYDERLLVGYDTSDDACVYKISDELVLVETLDFFPPWTIPSCSARSPRRTPSAIFMPWARSRSSR